jgi:hypothetical protein
MITVGELFPSASLVWRRISSSQTISSGKGYMVDTTAGVVELTLSGIPVEGHTIGIIDHLGTFNTNNVIIRANGQRIMGFFEDMVIDQKFASLVLVFSDATGGWRIQSTTPIGENADIYTKQNILGLVSQTGGVPTGAIIERGSNANGDYTKFADGTLICLHTITYASDTSALGSALFGSASFQWDFPATFLSTDNSVMTATHNGTLNAWLPAKMQTTTYGQFRMISTTSLTGERLAKLMVVGRWF